MKKQDEMKQQKKLQLNVEDVKMTNFITQIEKDKARQIFGGYGGGGTVKWA